MAPSVRVWWPCAVSMTSTSTPIATRCLGPHRRVAVDADRDADQQPPVGVDGRPVDGRAQRALAGDHPDQAAVVVDDGRHPTGAARRAARTPLAGSTSGAKRCRSVLITLPSWVKRSKPVGVVLGEQPDRTRRRRRRPPRRGPACGSATSASPTVCVGRQRDRRLEDRVAAPSRTRSRGSTTSTGMSWGSTAIPPRRATVSAMRRPATAVMLDTTSGIVVPTPSGVVRSTSNRDGTTGQARHHEHVAVGQVVAGVGLQQSHRAGPASRSPSAAGSSKRPVRATPGYGLACRLDDGQRRPVVLVHGWGGSFESTWQRNGFTALLDDAGRR